jgi:hypothetical protein
MKHGKHDDSLGLDTKKDGIWEAAHSNAENLAVLDGEAPWIFPHQLNGVVNSETNCEPRPARRSSYRNAASSNSRRAERRPVRSSLQAFSNRISKLFPRNDIVGIGFMLGESAIKLGALSIGQRQCSTIGRDAVPDILYQG